MRQKFATLILFSLASSGAWSQASSGTGAVPAAKPTTQAKPSGSTAKTTAPRAAAVDPTAVFETTAGTLRCTLFEKQTPLTVANFVGLANGTKDWKNPVSGSMK